MATFLLCADLPSSEQVRPAYCRQAQLGPAPRQWSPQLGWRERHKHLVQAGCAERGPRGFLCRPGRRANEQSQGLSPLGGRDDPGVRGDLRPRAGQRELSVPLEGPDDPVVSGGLRPRAGQW